MKKINKTPGYMYALVAAALLVAGFAILVGTGIIELGEKGLMINL